LRPRIARQFWLSRARAIRAPNAQVLPAAAAGLLEPGGSAQLAGVDAIGSPLAEDARRRGATCARLT